MQVSHKTDLLPLFAIIFLGFMGFALTITLFIPMLSNSSFGLVGAGTTDSTRALLSGLLLAMYPLGQFIGSPMIGSLSDYYGQKRVLIISLGLCVIGFLVMGLSIQNHSLIFLFISSFLTGLCESNMAIAQSIISHRVTDSKERTKLMGYAYSACSLGYVIGPLLGGFAGSYLGYAGPFYISAVLVLSILGWFIFKFNENKSSTKKTIKLSQTLLSLTSIFTQKKLRKIYLINFLIFFAVQGLYRVVPLYVSQRWHPSLHVYSLLISLLSLLCMLANSIFLKVLINKYTSQNLLKKLLLAGSIAVIIILIPDKFNYIWFTFGLAAMITVMALPTCTAWLSEQAEQYEQGHVLGNNQALLVLGESSSAALGGLLAAISISLPIMVMALVLLSGFGIILQTRNAV